MVGDLIGSPSLNYFNVTIKMGVNVKIWGENVKKLNMK